MARTHSECFLVPPPAVEDRGTLPIVGRDKRLRWDLAALAEALNARRRARGLTWKALATELRCTPNQLEGLHTVRFAIGMRLATRIVQ